MVVCSFLHITLAVLAIAVLFCFIAEWKLDKEMSSRKQQSAVDGVVKFYHPDCGPCKRLAPVWDEFYQKMHEQVPLAEVNCKDNPQLCQSQGIMGYPTVRTMKSRKEYSGPRTVEGLTGFALSAKQGSLV